MPKTASIVGIGVDGGLHVGLLLARGITRRRDWRQELALEGALGTVAACVETGVGLLLLGAEQHLGTGFVELLASACAGRELVLADVGERTELLVQVGTRVGRDQRDTGVDSCLDGVTYGVGVGERDGKTVDAVGDCLVDHRGLIGTRVVRALVLDRDAQRLAGILGTLLEH